MTWEIKYTRQAEKSVDALDAGIRRRVLSAIGTLSKNPRSAPNVKAMQGEPTYRLRVGDWRVIFALQNEVLTILVIRVAHRREAYR